MTTWIKVFNSMPSHPKLVAVGDRAAWLFVCGCCYSNEHLTDGFVPRASLPAAAPGVSKTAALAGRLVAAGLWHEVDGGWRINDYAEYQRSASEIRERRSRDAERKANVRKMSARTPRGLRKEFAGTHADVSASLDVEGRRQKAEKTPSTSPSKEVVVLCLRLADHIRRNDPKADPKPESKRWQTDMRLLLQDRNGDVGEVERTIDSSQTDSFWRSNILSPAKLRKHFTRLVLRAEDGRAEGVNPALPEWQRPRPEWLEQVKAHLEAQEA